MSQGLGNLQERGDPWRGGEADGGPMCRLHGHGPRDPKRFTCPEGQQEPAGLEVGATDRLDHAQTRDGRPAEVDPGEIHRGHLGLVPLAKAEPAQPEASPMPDQRGEGATRRLGHNHPQRSKQDAQQGQSIVQVTADEELGRGEAFQIKGLGRRGGDGRGQVSLGRLGAAAGVGQRIAQPLPEGPGLVHRSGMEFHGDPVESRGVVEGQRTSGLVGSARIELASARRIAGPAVMPGEDLGIDRSGGGENRRQPFVVPLQAIRRQVRHDRLPDPVVIDLDVVVQGQADATDQTGRAERGQGHPAPTTQLAGLEGQGLPDRASRNGHGPQQPLGLLRLPLDPRPEHFIQVELADLLPAIDRLTPLNMPDQLVDEQRVPTRLPRHHVRLGSRHGVLPPQKDQCQLARLGLRQRLDGQLAVVEPGGAGDDRLADLGQERTPLSVFRAEATQEQQDGRLRRAEQVREQDGAIDVAPLKVVDGQDQGGPLRQPGQQLAEPRERAAAQLLRVGHLRRRGTPHRDHRLDTLQDREDPGQEWDVRGQERLDFPRRQPLQVPRQGIDQAIQRLVRDRFSFVTPPEEDDRLVPGDEPVEERSDQRGFAGPRAAEDEDRLRAAQVEAGEHAIEDLEVPRPSDQGAGPVQLGDVDQVRDLAAEHRDDLATARPSRRVPIQQHHAEPDQVLRNPGHQRGRRWRRLRPLGHDQLLGQADKREPPRQCLVEHDADAVPVARCRDRKPGGLLRRHVGHGPDDLTIRASGAGPSSPGRRSARSPAGRPAPRGSPGHSSA